MLPVQHSMFTNTARHALVLLALVGWHSAQAAAIHKWVDEQGLTHYSDEPPQQSQTPVTQLQIETGTATQQSAEGAAPDDYYSIANQWQRMQQESQQRQQRELQRAELKRAVQPAAPAGDYRENRKTRYVAAYPRRHHRRRGHYPPIEHYSSPPPSPAGQISSGFPSTN